VPVLSPSFARALTATSSVVSLSRLSAASTTEAPADSLADKSMILGRVICYRPDTGEYDILDVDDSKKYVLPERQVVVLDLQESQRKLSKGETVFALYPDTTSFYPAVVSHAPRRTAMGAEPSVIVQFSGDEDASGTLLWSAMCCVGTLGAFMVHITNSAQQCAYGYCSVHHCDVDMSRAVLLRVLL
jgi:hypothetical protein